MVRRMYGWVKEKMDGQIDGWVSGEIEKEKIGKGRDE